MKMLNVFEVVPENCVRIISNVRLFVLGSCLHDKSSLWITPTPPPRPEARGAFTVKEKKDRLKTWTRTSAESDRTEYKLAKSTAKKVVARVKAEAIDGLGCMITWKRVKGRKTSTESQRLETEQERTLAKSEPSKMQQERC